MKNHQSLRRELIYDLSLLSFCAAILCAGVLLVSIRLQTPAVVNTLARANLLGLHDRIRSDPELRASLKTDPQNLDNVFYELLKELSLPEAEFSARWLVPDDAAKPGVFYQEQNRRYLLFFSMASGFVWRAPLGDLGTIEYSWTNVALDRILDRNKYLVFLFAIFISIVSVIIGYRLLLRKHILIPIQNLSKVASSFIKEDWTARVEVQRRDELGEIGEALNEMARKIQEKEKKLVLTIQSLQKANEEIEITKNEQLQIEKLASVGRLAAGVAHEVGNPLGAIAGYVDILRRAIQNPSKLSKEDVDLCDRIEAETNRISRIIRALLQQARPPQDRIRPTQILPILKRSVELAQIPASIDVEYDFQDEAAEVLGEKDQLIQVCLNLLINAKHAIEARGKDHQGKITVRVAQRKLAASRDRDEDSLVDVSVVRALKPQTYWVISIIDNGTGISAEDKKKLFEPFFTTKATGKGTGLGLYVAKSIIESFRGTIVVQSAPGYGSSFSLFLPRDVS